jgi:hypothetical protein
VDTAEILPGILDALINVVFVSIGGRTWNGVAQLPEMLDELIARLVIGESEKCVAFLIGDNEVNFVLDPVPVVGRQVLDGSLCRRHSGHCSHD